MRDELHTTSLALDDVYVLYGALRSGTTLVHLILGAHPNVTCFGESDFMLDYLEINSPGDAHLDTDALRTDWIFQSTGLDMPPTTDGRAALHDLIRQQKARAGGGKIVLVLHRNIERLMMFFPDLPIMHLLRDPRDVARSSIGMGWAGTTYHGIGHWIGTERSWARVGPALLPHQEHTLRYEDLLAAPRPILSDLCDFMGEAYSDSMMAYSQTSTYSRIDPSHSFQWKRKQTPDEISDVEYRTGPLLAASGYEPCGAPVRTPSRKRRIQLALKNRHSIWKKKFDRYGYIDPVMVGLGRRLGIKPLFELGHRNIGRKRIKYLK